MKKSHIASLFVAFLLNSFIGNAQSVAVGINYGNSVLESSSFKKNSFTKGMSFGLEKEIFKNFALGLKGSVNNRSFDFWSIAKQQNAYSNLNSLGVSIEASKYLKLGSEKIYGIIGVGGDFLWHYATKSYYYDNSGGRSISTNDFSGVNYLFSYRAGFSVRVGNRSKIDTEIISSMNLSSRYKSNVNVLSIDQHMLRVTYAISMK